MTRLVFRTTFVILAAILAVPIGGYAQDAALSGSVNDSTGGVLPGVTVTAVHTDSGNTFVAVTDERGGFRLPLRTGAFRVTFELSGFATVTRTLELLVGQQPVVNVQMAPATVQETVTVTGEAPLIDTTSSTIGGNIDPRQVADLPVNGRSWQDLALLAPGNRANAIQDAPVERTSGAYHVNIDGQQVTQLITQSGNFGNPKFSRDAIAEFELVANRFDATQGRSTGVQVNAITKSGTNVFAGTFASYFRDDRFNTANPVVDRVLPYSDQQMSTTFGGPIRRDRVHFFGNFEYEREPQTTVFLTPFPHFNKDQSATRREYTGGGRVDVQFSPQTRLSVRGATWSNFFPLGTGGAGAFASSTTTRASAIETDRWMNEVLGTLTQVVGDRAVNELKVGYAGYNWKLHPIVQSNWPPGLQLPGAQVGYGGPRVILRGGLVIGPAHTFTPQKFLQGTYSIRDNFTYSFTARGRHDLKLGGEYLHYDIWQYFCNACFGDLTANIAPIPANIESLFPDLLDASTWNLAPLSPIAIRWQQGFGKFDFKSPRYVSAGWVQDDWTITPRLTLNLGVRYDLQLNVFTNDTEILPHLPGGRPNDTDNLAPRLGAVYSVNDRTVIRGGWGLFFGDIPNTHSHYPKLYSQILLADVLNDGRPDFASNPFNGPTPTHEQLLTRLCTPGSPFAPGCIRRSLLNTIPSADSVIPYSHQTSIGLQRQIGSTMSVSADYVYTGIRKERTSKNVNLSYNPATRANYPFTDLTRAPFPDWGIVVSTSNGGRSNAHGLETSFTRRFSQGWQMSANYTLSGLWDAGDALFHGVDLPLDLAGEYSLAATDQRHRAVVNGIWDVGGGFQVSGLYFYGSGQRYSTSWGPDLRRLGVGSDNRLRPNGTIVPRNNLVGAPIHRVDMRLQQRVPLGGVRIDGILEVFNAVNRANFGAYTTQESNARYGQPNVNLNVAYVPRTLQLGFRIAF